MHARAALDALRTDRAGSPANPEASSPDGEAAVLTAPTDRHDGELVATRAVFRAPDTAPRPPDTALRAPDTASQAPNPISRSPDTASRPPDTTLRSPIASPDTASRAPGPVSGQPDIAALIQGGRHRDALAACAHGHGAVLGRLCMALLGSQADADEATQETLLRAHRGMASYRGDGSVKAWLCGIARHVCAHMLESRQRGRDLAERAAVPGELHDGADARRRARAIRGALEQLRPSEREAVVLRYVAELGHRDIATALQIDEPAARKRTSRALARLRAVLCDQEID